MKIIDFALCIGKIDDEADFEPAKIYPVLKPLNNDPNNYLRVVDVRETITSINVEV